MPVLDVPVPVAIWRFFTGAHFDGKRYSNATWLKPGTLPKAQLTWWTKLPRLHRALFRTGMVGIPLGWLQIYNRFPYWVLLFTGMILPYAIHRGWQMIATRGIAGIKVRNEYGMTNTEQNVTELVFPDTRKDAN